MKRSWGPLIVTLLVLVFFYAPLVVLVVNSFNESRFGGTWEGFTWKWYEKLWSADEVWAALVVTLKVAVSATLAATVLGTLAAWVLRSYATRLQGAHHGLRGQFRIREDCVHQSELKRFGCAAPPGVGGGGPVA